MAAAALAEAEFADAAAVLEWWQRQYEAVDDRMLADAVAALRQLAERDDRELESAFTRLIIGLAELESTAATLSVEQRMQRASLETLICATLAPPAEAVDQTREPSLASVLRRTLIGVARHGSPSGGEASLVPRLLVTSSPVGQVAAMAKAIAGSIKERLGGDAASGSRVTGLRLLLCTWEACTRRAREQTQTAVGGGRAGKEAAGLRAEDRSGGRGGGAWPEGPAEGEQIGMATSAADTAGGAPADTAGGAPADRIPLQRVGAALMNAAVDTVLFDSVGKVRRAGLRLLQESALHLPAEEVLKLALVKTRDRDKETRKMAFRIIGNFVGATSDETDPGAERRDRGVQGELAPMLCDVEAVNVLVHQAFAPKHYPVTSLPLFLHLRSGDIPPMLCHVEAVDVLVHQAFAPDGTPEMRKVAERLFWSFVISHVPDPAAALRSLGAMKKLGVYGSLLRGRADELYGAQFDEEEGTGDTEGEEEAQLAGDMAGEVH